GARRGGPRARARQGGGRHRLRPGLRVTARAVVALAAALAAAAPARAQEGGERATLAQLEQRSRAFYALLEPRERERAAAPGPSAAAADGRGLAFLGLGDTAKAVEDLSAAADTRQVGAKARAALEEARRRASGRKGSAEEDPEALLARLGDLLLRTTAGDAA